jgi:hypothetical protein
MGLFYDHIPGSLIQWIEAQHLFYVSTAPLSESQHVNVSPKGVENTFRLVYDTSEAERKDNGDIEWKSIKTNTVWYEDLTGSGAETIAHVKENGRITLMFVAFEGPPKIVRMFGTGACLCGKTNWRVMLMRVMFHSQSIRVRYARV